jgi:hypothetical protein
MHRSASADHEMHVLELWECAVGLDRWRRDDALLATGRAIPAALGARNAALLEIRNGLFAGVWPFRSRCPACGAECQFEVDSVVLADEISRREASESISFEWAGRSVVARPPTANDLKAVSSCGDIGSAITALLARCVTGELDLTAASDAELEEIGRRLEQLDPGAAVSFALNCPACSDDWSATVDVGDALWAELKTAAEQSLIEIDALARVYGWTEQEVLQLSPTRRAAYLQLVEGL